MDICVVNSWSISSVGPKERVDSSLSGRGVDPVFALENPWDLSLCITYGPSVNLFVSMPFPTTVREGA